MITLAIDTSTSRGSIALLFDERLELSEEFHSDRSHSSTLFLALEKARASAPRVDRLAIGLGPGSYAGVRIAIAAGIGIQMVQNAELVGIPSVAALETTAPRYAAVGDARRDTFYWTEVDHGVCLEGPLLLTEPELRERLLATQLPVYATEPTPAVPQAQVALPSAEVLARLATAGRGIVSRDTLEPIYLREPHITVSKRNPKITALPRKG